MYNSGKARSGAQGRQFNGDTFFSSLATTVQGLVAASSTHKAWLLNSMSCTAPVHPRTLEELVGPKVIAQVQASAPPQLRQAAKDLAEQGLDPTPEALAAHLGVPVPLVKCRLSSMKRPTWLDSAAFTARHRRAEDAREIARDRLVDAAL